jgi:adenosylcobyric acid synthase
VQTEVVATESDALALDRQRAQLEHALAVLVGDSASSFALGSADWTTALPPSRPACRHGAGAPARRVGRAERRAGRAGRVGVAQAAWFPNISLTGAGGYASPELGDLFKWSARSWGVGALLSLPIFDGGRREAGVQGARRSSTARWPATARRCWTAFQEVEDQLSSCGCCRSSRRCSVMVLGTTSGAGKSWLATALCRWYARQGLKVAPFKAQNMSNNARVVPGAGRHGARRRDRQRAVLPGAGRARRARRAHEPGAAQARARHAQPGGAAGQVDAALTRMPWRERSAHVWPRDRAGARRAAAENDVVVIEGAGSPAEINLRDSDIVNMRVARMRSARCLLVTDIDRGGAFAHLYGTWALLPEDERALLRGFVLNKFRGDASLLAPAPQQLQSADRRAHGGVLPMWRQHGLPEEDGVFDDRGAPPAAGSGPAPSPSSPTRASATSTNSSRCATCPACACAGCARRPSWPAPTGSCCPAPSTPAATWPGCARRGWTAPSPRMPEQGGAVLGICGGLQMLGEALVDPHGIDGNGARPGPAAAGDGVRARQDGARARSCASATLAGAWARCRACRCAATRSTTAAPRSTRHGAGPRRAARRPGLAERRGNVLGVYLHGLFEDPGVLQALFGARRPRWTRCSTAWPISSTPTSTPACSPDLIR